MESPFQSAVDALAAERAAERDFRTYVYQRVRMDHVWLYEVIHRARQYAHAPLVTVEDGR